MTTMLAPIEVPDTSKVAAIVPLLLRRAHALTIENDEALEVTSELLVEIKAREKEIDAALKPVIAKAHDTHRSLTSLRAEYRGPLEQAEKIVKGKIGVYELERRQRLEAEQRERERLAAEAAKREQEARAKLLEDVRILAARHKGQTEIAEAVREQPIVPVVEAAPPPPKIEGLSFRMRWQFRIVDVEALPRRFLMPNETAIRKVVDALGANHGIDGIEVRQEPIPIVASRTVQR